MQAKLLVMHILLTIWSLHLSVSHYGNCFLQTVELFQGGFVLYSDENKIREIKPRNCSILFFLLKKKKKTDIPCSETKELVFLWVGSC